MHQSQVAFAVIIALPVFAKGLANVFVQAPYAWLCFDYGSRILSLSIVFGAILRHKMAWRDIGISRIPLGNFLKSLVICTVLVRCIYYFGPPLLFQVLPEQSSLGSFPLLPSKAMQFFDISFGMALVAVAEEVLCRGIIMLWILSRLGATKAILFSSVLFALLHWSLTPQTILLAFFAGLVWGYMTWRTKNLLPAIASHYIEDIISFWPF